MSSIMLSTLGIFLFGGLIQGITGFGAAMVLVPLLCFVLDVKEAIILGILNGFVMLSYQLVKLRYDLSLQKLFPLLVGALPGIVAGVIFLKSVDATIVKNLIGSVLICYSMYSLLIKPKAVELSSLWGYFAGFLGGILTSSVGAGGLPVVIYSALTDWSKDEMKATMVGCFFLISLLTIIIYFASGLIHSGVWRLFGWSIPPSLLGAGMGMFIANKIDRKMYLLLVYYLLIIMGIMMFFQ